MLEDTDVYFECLASRKLVRVWVVSEVRYDYDSDGYCKYYIASLVLQYMIIKKR